MESRLDGSQPLEGHAAIAQKLDKYKWLLAPILAVATCITTWTRYQQLGTWISTMIARGFVVDSQGQIQSGPAFSYVVLVAFVFVVFLISWSIHAWYQVRNLRRKSAQPLAVFAGIDRSLATLISASGDIARGLYASGDSSRIQFDHYQGSYWIGTDGTAEVCFEVSVRASRGRLHYWEFGIAVEQEADEVSCPDDLNLRVKDRGARSKAVYLVSKNAAREKRILIFFLPELTDDEAPGRSITVSYSWPGFARKLVRNGREEFAWSVSSTADIPKVQFEIHFQKGIGNVDCEFNGTLPPPGSLMKESNGFGLTWRYTSENASPACVHAIRFTKAPGSG